MKIHPTSVVSPDIEIGPDVEIGPYCLIQGKGKIGKGTFVEGHVTLGYKHGEILIGENNHFSPGAVIGGPPQDISYKGEQTTLVVGNNNTFREFSTVNLPTSKGEKKTIIGNNCYIMAYAHVGHDCKLGNNVIMANNTGLAGHCEIEDNVVISAMCGLSQFTRVGRGAFIGGGSVINKDIPPFVRAEGHWAVVRATNKIGLIRRGSSREEVNNIHKAVRIMVMGTGTIDENIERIRTECKMSENLEHFIHFIKSSKKGIAISRGQGSKEVADE
ncbi:MAG: acyl-ACP--UDP-N-acetylglucosamine O-acyltransferase [Bdellovibrionales bacterium]|nr:acyl-ACP--UDP-N-acetylglucosamine O-acyltransferase [Bdellovibrionales bacterium]